MATPFETSWRPRWDSNPRLALRGSQQEVETPAVNEASQCKTTDFHRDVLLSDCEPFWRKVAFGEGCWEWTAYRIPGGYGFYRGQTAHRVAFELAVGPIPAGLQIDHLCRNRGCVNPAHLEAVTQRTNVLRGIGPAAQRAKQTHCKYGHEFTAENTYVQPRTNRRICRACWHSGAANMPTRKAAAL